MSAHPGRRAIAKTRAAAAWKRARTGGTGAYVMRLRNAFASQGKRAHRNVATVATSSRFAEQTASLVSLVCVWAKAFARPVRRTRGPAVTAGCKREPAAMNAVGGNGPNAIPVHRNASPAPRNNRGAAPVARRRAHAHLNVLSPSGVPAMKTRDAVLARHSRRPVDAVASV